jgi:hypothetical protein
MANPWLATAAESETDLPLPRSTSAEEVGEVGECQTTPRIEITTRPSQEEILLVAGVGDSIADDYAAYVRGQKDCRVRVVLAGTANRRSAEEPLAESVSDFVFFLKPRLAKGDRGLLKQTIARCRGVKFVGLISTFRVHLGDRHAAETENWVLEQIRPLGARVVVFRPGHILSRHSPVSQRFRRFGFCYPLVPRRLRSCFVEGEDLFAAIESERRTDPHRGARVCTLLGPNRSWKDLLALRRAPGLWPTCLTALSRLLSLLLLGSLAGLVLDLLARTWPSLPRWNFDTFRPQSLRELLALYNKYNYRHLKVVGYNTGVIHFGQSYPGKTIVSTVSCNRIRRISADLIKADCGTTVRNALDFLTKADQELPVVPNYSYVCLGTSFFIPIHGSASHFSTIADTITRVILYDPVRDRFIAASRNDPAFRECVYNLRADVLLLRLYLKVKPKSRYFVHRQDMINPGSQELLAALQDLGATNVEIRQSRASSDKVTVSKYYKALEGTTTPVIELPRDTLGRLWDRLEENPVTSFLMHALTRYFAWHVELFFAPEEFPRFWETHRELPLRKIQLRYIRQDGFPHSAFREHDCVSVDLFMLRWRRRRFEKYLKETFGIVRTNPGKHSR